MNDLTGRVLAVQDGMLLLTLGAETRVLALPPGCDLRAGDFARVRLAEGCEGAEVESVELLARPLASPFPPVGSDFLHLHERGARRLRNLQARARLMSRLRAFFEARGFVEVETPLAVTSPGVEVHLAAVPVTMQPRPGAALETRYLITSPEYHMKRLLSAGMQRIFQVCKVFRDGEHGGRHRPEFSMLEWYRAFEGYEALMQDCEALLEDLAEAAGHPGAVTFRGRTLSLTRPWRRLTFREALHERGGVADPDALSPQEQERVLVERVEPTLGMAAPEFLTEYPASMASLARRKPSDPTVAERFELYLAGVEVANAFSELIDATEQAARFRADLEERRARGLPEYPLDQEFLAALEVGVPPSTGIALGVDRLMMLLLDAGDIGDVLAF